MVLVPKWQFFQLLFFLGVIGQENVFYDILEQKNAFLGYKNKKFKKSKNWHFSKGVNPWFCSKIGHFSIFFFFWQYRPGKCFLWHSKTKKRPFYVIKTRSSKSRKIDIFAKGLTHGFGPKVAIFSTFFFRQYRPGKCILWYSRAKKLLSRLIKTRSSKSRKIDIFPKGLTHGFGPKMAIFPTFFF